MNMEMKSGIYMWTSPSGKSYIGQSVNLVDRRREFVRFDQYYAGHRINNARKKYNNESDWEYKVLEYCEPSELNEKEIYYIALYDTYHNGYNQCIGGSATLGYKFTDEQKKKMSIPIIQYTLEGKFVRDWIGAMEVKHVLGYNQGCITACCRGRQKTAYGFKWAYKNPPLLKKNEGLIKN